MKCDLAKIDSCVMGARISVSPVELLVLKKALHLFSEIEDIPEPDRRLALNMAKKCSGKEAAADTPQNEDGCFGATPDCGWI